MKKWCFWVIFINTMMTALACNKSDSSDDGESTTSASINAGVINVNSDGKLLVVDGSSLASAYSIEGSVVIAGQLALGTQLADSSLVPDKVIAFDVHTSPGSSSFDEILNNRLNPLIYEVDEERIFKAILERSGGVATNQDRVIHALVAYKSGNDRVAEGKSFQFISLGAGKNNLLAFPLSHVSSDFSMGQITLQSSDTNDEGVAELSATDKVFSMKTETIQQIANTSKILKLVRNRYMNVTDSYYLDPNISFVWRTHITKTDVNDWLDVDRTFLSHYDIDIHVFDHPKTTYSTFCNGGKPTVLAKLIPPASLTRYNNHMFPDTANVTNNITEFTNSGLAPSSGSNSVNYCTKEVSDQGTYATYSYNDSTKVAAIGLANSLVNPPVPGYWELKIDNETIGTFDLEAAAPSKKSMFLPSMKIVTNSSGYVTDVYIRFFIYNESIATYELMTDLSGLSAVTSINGVEISFETDENLVNYRLKPVDADGNPDESGHIMRAFHEVNGGYSPISTDTSRLKRVCNYSGCTFSDDYMTGVNLYFFVYNVSNNFVWQFKE